MYETKPYFYGTGRRKHSVARVRVYNGTGKMTINGRDINDYFGLETLKLLANSPLVLTENEGKFDVVVNVVGAVVMGAVVAATGSMEAQPVVTTGLLGGFTTFSAASLETAQDVRARRWARVVAVPLAMMIACLLGFWLGVMAVRSIPPMG